MKVLCNFLILTSLFFNLTFAQNSNQASEEILNPGFIKIKAANNKYVSIKNSPNNYSFDLSLEDFSTNSEPRQTFFIVQKEGNPIIFGSLNPKDYTFHSELDLLGNSKNLGQGFLSPYRNGSFQTKYYNDFSANVIKTFKITGSTNKYLITNVNEFNSKKENSFFGIDANGNFTIGLNKNDPNAQFEIEQATIPVNLEKQVQPTKKVVQLESKKLTPAEQKRPKLAQSTLRTPLEKKDEGYTGRVYRRPSGPSVTGGGRIVTNF
ncbi:MAG: hypothetical protein ABIA74_04530 [bacterium]